MHRDDRAETVPDQHGAIDLEAIHDRHDVARLVGRGIAIAGHIAVAVAAQVECRHPERTGEHPHGFAQEPDRQVAGDAMDQDHVRAGTRLLIVKVQSVRFELGHGKSLGSVR